MLSLSSRLLLLPSSLAGVENTATTVNPIAADPLVIRGMMNALLRRFCFFSGSLHFGRSSAPTNYSLKLQDVEFYLYPAKNQARVVAYCRIASNGSIRDVVTTLRDFTRDLMWCQVYPYMQASGELYRIENRLGQRARDGKISGWHGYMVQRLFVSPAPMLS